MDYAYHILSTIRPEELDYKYRPVYESLLHGKLLTALRKIPSFDKRYVVEGLIHYAREELLLKGFNEELLYKAIKLGYRLLRDIVYYSGGRDRKEKTILKGPRVDVRSSIYNFVRLNFTPIYMNYKRTNNIVVLLDTSGSMVPHGLWAITCLATFVHKVRYVVLFSDKVSVVKLSRTRSNRLIIQFLKTILGSGFRGNTDMVSALKEVNKIPLPGKYTLVIISDLKHNMPGDPVPLVRSLVNRLSRFIVITPVNHNHVLAEKVRSLGGEVFIVKSPLEIPRILKKRLNLKTSLVKERKRLSIK